MTTLESPFARVRQRHAHQERVPVLALGTAPLLLYVAVVLVAPLCVLALYSVWTADFFNVRHVFTIGNYRAIVDQALYRDILLKSVGIGLISAAIMTGSGFVVAYALTFRLRRIGTVLLGLIVISLLASYLARVYAWGTILGTNGVLNRSLEGLGLIRQPLTFLFYGYFAIVVTLVYVYLPIAILTIYGALQEIDHRTLEASRDLGAGRFRTLTRIVVPQARVGITAAFALTFILAASDYITPGLVGGARGQMVGSIIEDQFGGAANMPLGAALAFALVASFALVLAMLAVSRFLLAPSRFLFRVLNGRRRFPFHRRPMTVHTPWLTGRLRRLSLSIPATVVVVLFLLAPLVTVVLFSFNTSPVPSLPLTGLTGHWYAVIVSQPEFMHALVSSVITMLAAVSGGMLIGMPAAFSLARRRFRTRQVIQGLVYAPVAMPGIVIGTALLTALTYLKIRLGLFPTAFAHMLLVTPYIVIVIRARLTAFDIRIQEAARDLGATPGRVLRTITFPLMAPSLLGAALLAAAVSLDEILVTNFTIGANSTLPVWILSQIHRGITPAVNALAVIILGASLLLVLSAQGAMRLRAPVSALKELEELT